MKISFTGDVSFTGEFSNSLIDKSLKLDEKIINIFNSSDYNIVNLEGPAIPTNQIPKGRANVISPIEAISFLDSININIFNLANNHTFDFGIKGFIYTKNEILKYNHIYMGAGEDIEEASTIRYIKKDNITVGLIAVGSTGYSKRDIIQKECIFDDNNITLIEKKIKEARQNSDWLILNFHDGTEYNFYPVDYIQNKLKSFIDMGVDIIIGHHPHVPQGIEKYKTGLIFYSLGNFIFDLEGHRKLKYTNLSIIPSFIFKKNSYEYSYIITESSYLNKEIKVTENKLFYEHIELISTRLISSKFEYYRFKDTIRSVLFNPILGNSLKSNLAYPILLFLRFRGIYTGNSRSLLKLILKYLKLEFIYRKIKGNERLSEKYDY